MKKIEAYLKPFRLAEVRNALAGARFEVIRVLEAEEIRPTESYTEVVQGMEYEVDISPRVLVVLLVDDVDVDRAVELIQGVARTDHSGDGRILVSTVEQVLSVDPMEVREPEARGQALPAQ